MTRGKKTPEVDYEAAAMWPEARKWLAGNAPEWVTDAVQHMHNNLVNAVKKFRDLNARNREAAIAERAEKKKVQAHLSRGTVDAFVYEGHDEAITECPECGLVQKCDEGDCCSLCAADLEHDDGWTTDCPECGPVQKCDEDGCCLFCGADLFVDEDGNPLDTAAGRLLTETSGPAK